MKNINSICAHKITGTRGSSTLFENINISLQKGNLFFILGPNGSGKTTLLKIYAGMLKQSKGDIIVNNKKVHYTDYVRVISFLSSSPLFREDQTVFDYLIYWTFMYNSLKCLSYEYIEKALDRMGLINEKLHKISYLSLGQRKRLQIARMLLLDRLIWIMDEPTIGLDKYWVEQLSLIMEEKCRKGGIVILTTHLQFNVPETSAHILYIE